MSTETGEFKETDSERKRGIEEAYGSSKPPQGSSIFRFSQPESQQSNFSNISGIEASQDRELGSEEEEEEGGKELGDGSIVTGMSDITDRTVIKGVNIAATTADILNKIMEEDETSGKSSTTEDSSLESIVTNYFGGEEEKATNFFKLALDTFEGKAGGIAERITNGITAVFTKGSYITSMLLGLLKMPTDLNILATQVGNESIGQATKMQQERSDFLENQLIDSKKNVLNIIKKFVEYTRSPENQIFYEEEMEKILLLTNPENLNLVMAKASYDECLQIISQFISLQGLTTLEGRNLPDSKTAFKKLILDLELIFSNLNNRQGGSSKRRTKKHHKKSKRNHKSKKSKSNKKAKRSKRKY